MMTDHNKQIGLLATVIFHTIVAVLLFVYCFVTPLPLPEEQGVLINFGTDAVGKGEIETGITPTKQAPTPPPQPSSKPETSSDKTEKEYMTQDFEESAKLEEQKRKEKQKRQEEEEKKRKEELEQRKREEEERKRREEEQRIAEQRRKIEESTKSAFGQANTNSTSDGTGNAFGNQGNPQGSPDSKSYVGGQGTEGIGYSLTGRTPQGGKLPAPRYPTNEEGTVVVRVKVDQLGNVTEAVWQPQGSTITNRKLIDAAIEAAKNAKFNQDPKADPIQVGTITYRFNIR